MRKIFLSLFGVALFMTCLANGQHPERNRLAHEIIGNAAVDSTDCDTLLEIGGYTIRLIREKGKTTHIGLNLFSENVKEASDRRMLDFIEEALLARCLGIDSDFYGRLVISQGNIGDFRRLNPDSSCSINSHNARLFNVEWDAAGRKVSVSVPAGYSSAREGTRSDVENDLIARLRKGGAPARKILPPDTSRLEPYGAELYILPGHSYQNKEITNNVYYISGDSITPVWSADHPLESIADLFLLPSGIYGDVEVSLTVLKHEYGDKETFSLPISRLLDVLAQDGCDAYWGVEKFADGLLVGGLFFYNPVQGYDHVLKIECRPEDVIAGKGLVKARAGLYVPTNNVRNLLAPYVRKSEKEKINYGK